MVRLIAASASERVVMAEAAADVEAASSVMLERKATTRPVMMTGKDKTMTSAAPRSFPVEGLGRLPAPAGERKEGSPGGMPCDRGSSGGEGMKGLRRKETPIRSIIRIGPDCNVPVREGGEIVASCKLKG